MNEVKSYFDSCVAYWMREHNLSRGSAMVRVIWWDCVELWNMDKSWDDTKIEFINRYRKYKPYDPIPASKLVEEGNA